MTPEVPQISMPKLPTNYLETPQIEGYRESLTLHQLQTINSARVLDYDQMSMPRHYNRRNEPVHNPSRVKSVENISSVMPRKTEKSKRLMVLRGSLPKLQISAKASERQK